jgi:hypothetical protein
VGRNSSSRWIPAAAAAFTAVAVIAGCGAQTKTDFVAQADAICASAVRELRSVVPPSSAGTPSQQRKAFADYLSHAALIVQAETAQLRAIRRPQQDGLQRAALAHYLAAMTRTVSGYQALASAAQSGNQRAIAAAESVLAADPVASLAAAYGLRSCATPGATIR